MLIEASQGLWHLSWCSVNIYSLDFGDSSLTSDGRGFVLTVKDFAISFSTDFLLHEYDWYSIIAIAVHGVTHITTHDMYGQ